MAKKIQTRNSIEKTLGKARQEFLKAKSDLDKSNKELQSAQGRVDDASKRLTEAKRVINSNSERIKIMDLTGAKATKGDEDDVSYVIDGKDYKVKFDNNDVQVEPVVRKKKDVVESDPDSDNGLRSLIDGMSSDNDRISEKISEFDELDEQAGNGDEYAGLEKRIAIAELRDAALGIKKGEYSNWSDKEIKYLTALMEIRS